MREIEGELFWTKAKLLKEAVICPQVCRLSYLEKKKKTEKKITPTAVIAS